MGHWVWMGVGCPCPPVRNDIVTPRHLLTLARSKLGISPTELGIGFIELGIGLRITHGPHIGELTHENKKYEMRTSSRANAIILLVADTRL